MKVVHTVASVDDEAAGPSYSVPSLVAALARAGHDAEVAALGDGSRRTQLGARVKTLPRDKVWPQPLMRLGRSKAMRSHLLDSGADVFHAHGLWMMPCVYPADAARALNVPLVMAPRGMLGRDALAFSKNTKLAFWAAFQKRACERVNCFHATAESELEDIRAFGLRQPVAVIPNGIDLPDLTALGLASRPDTQAPFILSLGRVHPKKGLNRLIAGFAQMADAFPRHSLRIIGPTPRKLRDDRRRKPGRGHPRDFHEGSTLEGTGRTQMRLVDRSWARTDGCGVGGGPVHAAGGTGPDGAEGTGLDGKGLRLGRHRRKDDSGLRVVAWRLG
jgi:glycosyltransferase involved in cell wall biosynthesis